MDAECAAAGVGSPSPVILWNGTTALLVCEQEVVTECPQDEITTALLATYYCFNISYPKGSSLFYTLLEILLLDKVPPKILPKIATMLSALENTSLD